MWPNNGCQVFSSSCKMSHFMVSQHFLHGRAFRSSSSSFACCSELPLWHLDNKVCGLSQCISEFPCLFLVVPSVTASFAQLPFQNKRTDISSSSSNSISPDVTDCVLKCTYEANPKFTEDHFSFPSSSKRKQKQKLSLCYQRTEDTILPSDDGVRGGVWRVHITLFFDFRKHGLM